MKRGVHTILLVLGCLLLGSPSHAGSQSNGPEVIISNDFFAGSIGAARNSADTAQYIGCLVYGTSSGKSVYCSARDAAGRTAACSSNTSQLAEAVAAMNENVIFDIGFGQGICTHISVSDVSYSPPMSP